MRHLGTIGRCGPTGPLARIRICLSTGSFDVAGYNMGSEFLGVTTHSEFATYVTAIGLYNDENELLAVGKPAMPIKNEKELSLTFVVRFDTN